MTQALQRQRAPASASTLDSIVTPHEKLMHRTWILLLGQAGQCHTFSNPWPAQLSLSPSRTCHFKHVIGYPGYQRRKKEISALEGGGTKLLLSIPMHLCSPWQQSCQLVAVCSANLGVTYNGSGRQDRLVNHVERPPIHFMGLFSPTQP